MYNNSNVFYKNIPVQIFVIYNIMVTYAYYIYMFVYLYMFVSITYLIKIVRNLLTN